MKSILSILVATAAAALLMSGLAEAHHGYGGFETKTIITLAGTVTDFHFVNPHSIVEFDVKDDKGQVRNWQGQLGSPGHLAPRGWTRNSLEPGAQISVSGYAARNNAPSIWITKIGLSNGQEFKIDGGN